MKSKPPKVHLLWLPAEFDAGYQIWCGTVDVWDDGVLFTQDSKLVTCGDCKSRKPGAACMAKKRREERKARRVS